MASKIARVIAIVAAFLAFLGVLGCCSINDNAPNWLGTLMGTFLFTMLCIGISVILYDWDLTKAKFTAFVVIIMARKYRRLRRKTAVARMSYNCRKHFKTTDDAYNYVIHRSLQYDKSRKTQPAAVRNLKVRTVR